MKVGEKLLLINHGRNCYRLDSEKKFVEVEIIEEKQVPGEYSRETFYKGFRAKDSDGNTYVTNWNVFDDATYGNPYTNWEKEGYDKENPNHKENFRDFMFLDINYVVSFWSREHNSEHPEVSVHDCVTKNMAALKLKEEFPQYEILFCDEHTRHYLKNDECAGCRLERTRPERHAKARASLSEMGNGMDDPSAGLPAEIQE